MNHRFAHASIDRAVRIAVCLTVGVAGAALAQPTTAPVTTAPATTAPATTSVASGGVRTANDLSREMLAFDERFVIQAYAAHGHRDPKWDADAVKLLRAGVDADACDGVFGGFNRPREANDPPPLADRIALARRIVGTDCDDAMVLWFAANAIGLDTSARDHESVFRATMGRAIDVIDNAPYCPLYRMCIWDQWARLAPEHQPSAAEVDKMRDRFRVIFRQVLTDKETLPTYRAVVAYRGIAIFDDPDNERADRIATAVADAADQADPWLWQLYMGRVEINRAWLSRGNGFANTVTEDGWRGFREHLDAARTRLLAAADLDRTLPNPYAFLIIVAMGQSSGEERGFLLQARQREMDYEPAFNTYRQAIRPRWGGSLATELAFGVSCADTNRVRHVRAGAAPVRHRRSRE